MGIKINGHKALIVTAPSGSGKTTIVHHLLNRFPSLSFSVSATTRKKRDNEKEGIDYYFLNPDTFRQKISSGDFLEWEEVYPSLLYGTLKAEVERLWTNGKTVVFDVDVKGALNLKKYFNQKAMALFIRPPSIDTLKQRLSVRGSEDEASLKIRLKRAGEELKYQNRFDRVLVNDGLEKALLEAENIVRRFLKN